MASSASSIKAVCLARASYFSTATRDAWQPFDFRHFPALLSSPEHMYKSVHFKPDPNSSPLTLKPTLRFFFPLLFPIFFSLIFFYILFTIVLSQSDFSQGKFGLPSPGKANCDRVALPNLRFMLRAFRVSIIHRTLTWTTGSLTCAQM